MVVDRLENLEKYASLNPLFAKAMEYLKTTDLNAQELGKKRHKAPENATGAYDGAYTQSSYRTTVSVPSRKRFVSNLSPHFSNTFPDKRKIYLVNIVILNIFFLFCPRLAIPRQIRYTHSIPFYKVRCPLCGYLMCSARS